MALKLNLESSPIGVPVPEAYARITNLDGHLGALLVLVEIHATADARQGRAQGVQPIERRRHEVDPSTLSGPLGQALYNHLKTLPEYAGAVDC